jgi:protein O-GlcNAc transferase
MKRCLLFFVCVLFAPLFAQIPALDQGVELIREGRFDQALPALEEAHRLAPRNATIENLLGITETKLGHINAANSHYLTAISLDPSMPAPHRNLGFNLLTEKKFAAAAQELRKASRLDPTDPFAHSYLMSLDLATGKDGDAVEQASLSGKLVDNDPQTAASLAGAEIRTGHIDEAAARIDRLEQDGNLPPDRAYQLAVLFTDRDAWPQAIDCLRRIAAAYPAWQNRYNLALALLYGNQPVEASTILSALHQDHPDNAEILMFLGSAYEAQQKLPEALDAYRAAAAADPTNPDHALDYTRLLMDSDRYDEAVQVIENGLGKTAQTAPLELRLGAIQMIKGNYDAAREAFNSALASHPDLDVAYVGLAQTYARQANDAEALKVLESARRTYNGHYLLEYYFGMLANRLGRFDDARTALENAAKLDPRSPDPQFELGKLFESQQDWEKARLAFKRVVALRPQFAPAHYQLSRVYARMGLHSEASAEAKLTSSIVESQRDQAFRDQRARAGGFKTSSAGSHAEQ